MTKFVRGSRPSSGRASNFFDEIYQRKSEIEHRNHVFWESTAKYFDRAHRENKMFQFWNSDDSVARSEKALAREQMADSMRSKKEETGHDRPGHVVRREERRFIEDVNSGIVHQGEKDMKKERQIYKLQREAEQKKDAEDLMKQHWKLNDPAFKELQNRKSNAFPKLNTSTVNHEKDSTSPSKDESTEDKLEELKKFVAEENERLDKNVEKNVKFLSDDKLAHWKESIMKFISDSKVLKENEEKIQRQLARSRLLQDQLEDFRKRHEKLEKKRNEVDLDDYFSRQFRLRLQIKSKTVESNLEDDRRLLDELQTCLRIHEFKSNSRNIHQFLDEIITKKSFESKKRQETGLLFSEEAEKTWFKDCVRWKEESFERSEKFRKLFADLLEDLRQKLQTENSTLESYKQKRLTIEETIEKLSQDLQEEEDRLRKEQNKKEAILEDLEHLDVSEPVKPSNEERFRSKNELGVELVGWNGDPNFYKIEYGDYRRKKVQWFY